MDNIKYSQPDFYRFNRDSINLAIIAFDFLKTENISTVLDLAAGSGVVGIEFYLKLNKNVEMHFLEKQKEFIPHLKKNIESFNIKESKIINEDMFKLEATSKYDLLLCNPPYFVSEESRLGPNENRNLCRIIMRKDIEHFFKVLNKFIAKNTYICLCFPKDSKQWMQQLVKSDFTCLKEIIVDNIKFLILQNI